MDIGGRYPVGLWIGRHVLQVPRMRPQGRAMERPKAEPSTWSQWNRYDWMAWRSITR